MSPFANHINSSQNPTQNIAGGALLVNGFRRGHSRSRTPNLLPESSTNSQPGNAPEAELSVEDNKRTALFHGLFARSESALEALFSKQHGASTETLGETRKQQEHVTGVGSVAVATQARPLPKKAARTIDEDNYDDSDEEVEEDPANNVSPLKAKSTGSTAFPRAPSPIKKPSIPLSPAPTSIQGAISQWQGKTSEDARKRLEENKKAAEDAAKRSFHTMFYPIDNDRDAMLEQQKLEESDRQVDVEMSGHGNASTNNSSEGTLSQANLGASSLVLKHLIARIDACRDKVLASDQELRSLMIEVKKNRSKWASEEKVGQEELYEAAEKVLSEVKAMTEHSQPFLQRVNKREAPDYYNIIKHPMDLSTMTKKLKGVQYKSKQEFVEDLNLIWANCLKYNADPAHYLRKHALFMRKETEKLVPLIPDIVIRDRAEVEAEERRLHNAEGDLDGAEDSDDEPIISSRGRKAPGKKAKKGAAPRKAPPGAQEGTPGVEVKPVIHGSSNGSSTTLRQDCLRAEYDAAMEGSQNGLSTPPPGTLTPAGLNGVTSAAVSSQVDPMDVDGFGTSVNGTGPLGAHEVDYDDLEYRTWKQVTKKDRALVASERHRLFKGDHLNPEEPALLRNKAAMRRWLRKQREAETTGVLGKRKRDINDDGEAESSGETLAEGMDGPVERVLPEYYDTLAAIPDFPMRMQWIEDGEGNVQPATEEFLRVAPTGLFTSTEGPFTKKISANLRQLQETRKVCAKIGIVKQMQLQSQMYQNQFQKYDPEPFIDRDIEPVAASEEGPILSGPVSRAALQRSVAKVFYQAGFEDFQPSALEAVTDLASEYLTNLTSTLFDYTQKPKRAVTITMPGSTEQTTTWQPKYTAEEAVLQTLQEEGVELESLENYVKEDVDRMSGKLGVLHERMKSHLADLLRPALSSDAGPDGVNAFNDGSEQFVGGDFAEDLDEDFFGFKELGLDKEFGLSSLSVPLHLLQNRMHNAYQASQNNNATVVTALTFEPPPPYPPLTRQSLQHEIDLIKNFFSAKLHANNDAPLVEDEDLPQKQRFPKPRLPPTGKISSPRKKPVREPGPGKGHPRKKMRMVEGEWVPVKDLEAKEVKAGKGGTKAKGANASANSGTGAVNGVGMEREESRDEDAEGEIDDGDAVVGKGGKGKRADVVSEGGMISPESLEAT